VRVLIRAGKAPHDIVGAEAALAYGDNGVFGANVGNLLFSDSVYRALNVPGARVVADSFQVERTGDAARAAARIADGFDAYVLPLANAFRGGFARNLDRLSSVIEKLTMPVVVIGVGMQQRLDEDRSVIDDATDEAVVRFMRAVLDRSPRVGVRGEETADYLKGLGFGPEHVEVIGCPSVYDVGPDFRAAGPSGTLTTESPIAINVTPTVAGMGKLLMEVAERYPHSVFVPQQHEQLALLLWGEPIPYRDRPKRVSPGIPVDTNHPLYRQDRILFPLGTLTWRRFLATQRFAFGNRVHGTIAALTAGIPAMLLSHDYRTRELARHHQIPYREVPHGVGSIDIAELYESTDVSAFNRALPENFRRYVAFLDANGLTHIHQPGHANPEYAARLERLNDTPLVHSLYSGDTETLIGRLRWLRQGSRADKRRRHSGFVPSFTIPADKGGDPGDVEALGKRLAALESTVQRHDRVVKRFERPVEKRIVSSVRSRLRRLLGDWA
jgi:hypothetical protein